MPSPRITVDDVAVRPLRSLRRCARNCVNVDRITSETE